jgi:predicted transcriptional regulator
VDDLTPDEQTAFIDIYGAHGDPPVAAEVIESLARRGLIKQYSDGKVRPTAKGTELYERMQGDEPYEGV